MANQKVEIKYKQLFINNEFVDSVSGKTFTSINPVDESVVAEVAEGDKADVDKAVMAAQAAFARGSEWRNLQPAQRAALLNKLADLAERDAQQIASIQTLENGKPFLHAVGETRMAAGILRYYAGWCDKIHGQTMPTDDGSLVMTRKEPVGVAGQITPWNFPVILLAFKWGPALAAGCTLVLKPAEQTPLCNLYIAALTKEAGFPPGVINIVTGYGPTAGAALAEHPDVSKIAFTGSVEVGKKIMVASGNSNLKRVSLELGGKSPLVIFDDVDVDEAAQKAHDAIFNNAGQLCFAASRTYVHSKIYEEFVKKSKELALKRKLGDPFDGSTDQGPQVEKEIFDRVIKYIEIGKKEGATLVTGGERLGQRGFFIQPTIFADVKDEMTIAKEEIFGPVQSILKFDSIEDVIKRANKTTYGLAAGVLTNDINKAIKFAQSVESGNVWVNHYGAVTPQAPFGGYKQSGIGRELGAEALDQYLETKTISIKVSSNY
ncbi:aldehyde dehydrogenase X, mitochondrial-like isoform X1 [Microplitis mediator]|uniref:aldehyde dehydrogenase X, mitochondrial-like isoform X1 n=2 Tax=Microplitis mediator TaxID=375433 RepID=UPI00255421D9|nr:aldehyde dehydrogenase X, mitochondrial-like isoform X1 [Microplitis mediator]